MSRWKSPKTAARRAERVAQEANKQRKENYRMWLLLAGIGAISIGLTVADVIWVRHRARERRERQHQLHHQGTNAPLRQTNR